MKVRDQLDVSCLVNLNIIGEKPPLGSVQWVDESEEVAT